MMLLLYHQRGRFETSEMAEEQCGDVFEVSMENNNFTEDCRDDRTKMCHSNSLERGIDTLKESDTEFNGLGHVNDISEPTTETSGSGLLSTQEMYECMNTRNVPETNDLVSDVELNSKNVNDVSTEDKENCIHAVIIPGVVITDPSDVATNSLREDCPSQRTAVAGSVAPHPTPTGETEADDAEVVRKAREDGRVEVVFPGSVTQEGCCRFVSEILKCILYQRQQLPMTYDQLVYSQKKQQAAVQSEEVVGWRPVQSAGLDWRKSQRTLQELEEVLQQLEVLFSLSLVPRVLLLLGGSPVLPKELYEVNMEAVILAASSRSLRVSACLRQVFRTLFVADLLSDTRPVRLMTTTVMVLGHRDCGVGWFRPKLDFKVPTRVKNQVIALSCDPDVSGPPQAEPMDWQDYVWFQAPMPIKGFNK